MRIAEQIGDPCFDLLTQSLGYNPSVVGKHFDLAILAALGLPPHVQADKHRNYGCRDESTLYWSR